VPLEEIGRARELNGCSLLMMRSDSRLYRGARGSLYAPEFANTIEAPEGGRLAWIAAVGTSTLTVVGAAGFLKTRLGCHPKSGGDLRMLTRSYREAPGRRRPAGTANGITCSIFLVNPSMYGILGQTTLAAGAGGECTGLNRRPVCGQNGDSPPDRGVVLRPICLRQPSIACSA
jgi:hypothetical protein